MSQSPPSRRCAIYTRKSSEEGLDQSFNSLHAQREACEAYVMSQAGEGWQIIPTIYDDPGYSGGAMDRPALQQLMRDVADGQIDTVVVYKVDRLTRSLADFAKIVEAFDQQQVTFVSVTQAFNTTTSMGRLTLNVLLSFAQFEREVTGERIRDKIAASKAKGMWMGGNPPLGYDPKDRTLVVNKREAEQVRRIFQRYLELGSVHALEAELRTQDVRSKRWLTRKGEPRGGERFSRGALYHLLKNPVYLGRIPHKSQSYPGQHPPILDEALFDQVQAKLTENRVAHKHRPLKGAACVLKGRIFNDVGEPMSPAIAYGKGGSAYRYYVAASVQQGRSTAASIRRVSAPATEAWLKEQLSRILGPDHTGLERVQRVTLLAETVTIDLQLGDLDGQELVGFGRSRLVSGERLTWIRSPELAQLSLPVRLQLRGGRTSIDLALPRRGAPDPSLLKAIRKGHALLKSAGASPLSRMRRQSLSRAISDPYEQALARLAFLAPEIQRAIVQGQAPAGLTLSGLLKNPLPLSWPDQRRLLGFPARPELAETG